MGSLVQTKLGWKRTLPFEHHDKRGSIYQTFQNIVTSWQHENVIVEEANVLRGLHYDNTNWKLACCLYGRIRLALLDPKTFQWEMFDWSVMPGDSTFQVLIPPGIANGHEVLSRLAVFHYLWSHEYEEQQVIKWNDPRHGIPWKLTVPILSERDG